MDINWRAVGFGFLTAIVIGLLSGLGLPFTDATLPAIGAGLTGVIAGAVAGYISGGPLARGAVHGGLATIIGSLIVAAALFVVGTLTAGLIGAGVALAFLFYVLVTAIPGVVGGAIGSVLKRTSGPERTEHTA